MGLLSHKMLQIVKGVGPTPGDTASAEQPLIAIDLLDSGSGISLDLEDGWEPNIPSLKNGGVWADSPINDGRTLVAGANTNVTETMRLIVSTQSALVYAAIFSSLQRQIQDARDFWDTFNQIEPVYLAWWAANAPGPQYALIYNIDMDLKFGDSEDASASITLTIERECDWHGIHIGGSPLQWTMENFFRVPFTAANASLYTGTQHIGYSTVVSNAIEFATAYTFSVVNYIDIPGSSIPGDAQALISIAVGDFPDSSELYIAKTTKPTAITDRSGNVRPAFNDIPCSGMTIVSGVLTADAVNGIVYAPVSAARRTVVHTPAGATEEVALTVKPGGSFPTGLNLSLMRGMYAVFLRAEQIGGAVNQSTARLQLMTNATGLIFFNSGQIRMGLAGTESNLMYMGVATIPIFDRILTGFDGKGVQVETDFGLELYTTRTAGAGTHRLIDVILMPIDEGIVYIKPEASTATTTNVFDNTGYLTHGPAQPAASARIFTGGVERLLQTECRGNLTLTPGVNNRLYFLNYNPNTLLSLPGAGVGIPVRVDIVPQWTGVRDK